MDRNLNYSDILSLEQLKKLGTIGYADARGTSRVAYSDAFFEGRDYVRECMESAGLVTRIDSVGNLFGVKKGKSERKLLIGSHIDTVPNGGIYDGTLGVFAGIELVRRLSAAGYENYFTIELVAWNEEEGNAVGGTFGSRFFIGEEITGHELEKAARFGISRQDTLNACGDLKNYVAYLELHIEQGGLLEAADRKLGVVEGIVGIVRYRASVAGTANHAGSTPMSLRDDALEKSCILIADLMKRVREQENGMVCTVGVFDVPNSAVNVIPANTEFIIEMRYKSIPEMKQLMQTMKSDYEQAGFAAELYLEQIETSMDKSLIEKCERICRDSGLAYRRMYSGAGHDAMNIARVIPSAMLFIPSVGGVSHTIREYSRDEDVLVGFRAIEQLYLEIDGEHKHEN